MGARLEGGLDWAGWKIIAAELGSVGGLVVMVLRMDVHCTRGDPGYETGGVHRRDAGVVTAPIATAVLLA